jgi:cyanate permease
MYTLILAFHAFFVTGLTFHVVSLFDEAGLSRTEAISIFIPITVVSVITSIAANFISDWINIKLLLYIMIGGAMLASGGLLIISHDYGTYLIMIGLGITGGLFAVINAITWPRFFGRKHLGAISGKAMSAIVMASALGPYLFSSSKSILGSYSYIAYACLVFLLFLSSASIKANVPKEKY